MSEASGIDRQGHLPAGESFSPDGAPEIISPPAFGSVKFQDGAAATQRLIEIYDRNTSFLRDNFARFVSGNDVKGRFRAYYPEIRLNIATHERLDNRLSYGFVAGPGTYSTTITQPELYQEYLAEQLDLLIKSHKVPVEIGESRYAIPLHFAFSPNRDAAAPTQVSDTGAIVNYFDVPDLADMDDSIANGMQELAPGAVQPLAQFTGPRVDFSLHRLSHYTATAPVHFQKLVIFTNYQFYVDEFSRIAESLLRRDDNDYCAFVGPGNVITEAADDACIANKFPDRPPQMPAYHLKQKDGQGVSLVNIGVGPSNAKTITDHIAVLRPHAWIMLGHCAGLRNSQRLGDYVLAHGYVREDHVLDADLPSFVPIPPLAEIQMALERAGAEVTGLTGYDLKAVMRTGTVASIDNRNWELRDHREPIRRFSQSRAIALDMESATIAANGFRLRVPYGTLLCVSDKPLHGELKLPGMASEFYKTQISRHLKIGIMAMEILRDMPSEQLHSRKLRSFNETAFQ